MRAQALIGAALDYARREIPVVPAEACGKRPLVSWRDGGSTDPTQLARWWTTWPDANVAIVCGHGSLLAIDLDSRQAAETLAATVDRSDLARAIVVRTGRAGGGWHLLWRYPPDSAIATSKPAPGLEVRGRGAVIIAPPSMSATGRRYRIVRGSLDDLCAPPARLLAAFETLAAQASVRTLAATAAGMPSRAVAPNLHHERLRRMLEARSSAELERLIATPPANHRRYGEVALASACQRVATTQPGGRHTAVNREAFALGGLLDETGLDPDDVIAQLEQAAEAAGLTAEADRVQTRRTIRRALGSGRARPTPIPELRA